MALCASIPQTQVKHQIVRSDGYHVDIRNRFVGPGRARLLLVRDGRDQFASRILHIRDMLLQEEGLPVTVEPSV